MSIDELIQVALDYTREAIVERNGDNAMRYAATAQAAALTVLATIFYRTTLPVQEGGVSIAIWNSES